MVGWAPVDLRPGRAPARGYSGPGRFPLRTLTSGLRPEGRKNPEYLQGHMVTGEPVNVSGWSGSHGDGGARERLRMVARVVRTGCVLLESWTQGLVERLPGDHMGCM